MTEQIDIHDSETVEAATRAELLTRRAAALRRLDQQYNSMRALLGGVVAVLVAAAGLLVAGLWLDEGLAERNAAANVVLGVLVLAVVAAWPARVLVRRWRSGGEIAAARQRWLDADATATSRGLPAGDITSELRTAWDARADDDFETVAARHVAEAQAALAGNGMLARAVLGGFGLALGVAAALVAGTSTEMPLFAAGGAAASLVLLVSSGRLAAGATRDAYRVQRRFDRRNTERTVLTGERLATGRSSVETGTPKVPVAARVAAALVGAAIAALLLLRAASGGLAAIVIVLAVVIVAIAMVVVAGWRVRTAERAAERAARPAAAAGAGVVGGALRFTSLGLTAESAPPGAVTIDGEQIRLSGPEDTSIPVTQVAGATVTAASHPFGRRTVAVYTSGGATLMLATTAGRRAQRLLSDAGVELVGMDRRRG